MTPPPDKQFSGIFISYRRDDAAGHAGRLYDRLSAHFGGAQVFMDIDHIEPGEDFVKVIEDAVGSCEVLLAIIGRDWLDSKDAAGRRLDNANDFIRLEINTALSRGVRVIPVLVQGARMPQPQELPAELSALSRRNALELSDMRWPHDVSRLIDRLDDILDECRRKKLKNPAPPAPPIDTPADPPRAGGRRRAPPTRTLLAAAAALAVVAVVVAFLLSGRDRTREGGPGGGANVNNVNAAEGAGNPGGQGRTAGGPVPPDGMVYVPGGEFMMGRDGDDEFERPAHSVTVRPFFIDKREVTCAEYAEFVSATGHRAPPGWKGGSCPRGALLKPVTDVEWKDAGDYCAREGKRLPGEAEWEFAARGTDGRLYPWGNDWRRGMANVAGAGLADVMEWKGVSPFGLFDMAGNAWEWTADKLKAYPNGEMSYQPKDDDYVIRGGSYADRPNIATTTYRAFRKASGDGDGYDKTGFRCAKTPEPSTR